MDPKTIPNVPPEANGRVRVAKAITHLPFFNEHFSEAAWHEQLQKLAARHSGKKCDDEAGGSATASTADAAEASIALPRGDVEEDGEAGFDFVAITQPALIQLQKL
jgi:hypothetical protein